MRCFMVWITDALSTRVLYIYDALNYEIFMVKHSLGVYSRWITRPHSTRGTLLVLITRY